MESICLHDSCNCGIAPGESYCSDVCRTADHAALQGADCGCGHPECQAAPAQGPPVTGGTQGGAGVHG